MSHSPRSTGSRAQVGRVFSSLQRKLQRQPQPWSAGLEASEPYTGFKCFGSQGERQAGTEQEAAATTRGKAPLPLREVFHPLQVPAGEVKEGKGGLLQDRSVPHSLLQADQPQRLETEGRNRGERHPETPAVAGRTARDTTATSGGDGTGSGLSGIRTLSLALLSAG